MQKNNKKHVYWGRFVGAMSTFKASLVKNLCTYVLSLPRFSKMGEKYDFQAI
jgi:hypothetical protein